MTADGTSEKSDWPSYNPGPSEHIHAVGVLSVNYNDLEAKLLSLLKLYARVHDDVAAFLFEKMPTETRLEWLTREISSRRAIGANLLATLLHFAKAYKICTDNRNLLVHSRITAHRVREDSILVSKRVRKDGTERFHDFSLATIRQVADEIRFWNRYGSQIIAFVYESRSRRQLPRGYRYAGPTTLPEISPLPKELAKRSPDGGQKPPRPPRSSRA